MTESLDDTRDELRRAPDLLRALLRGRPETWTAGSYDADVGPWKADLGILLRRDDPAAVPG